MLLSFLKRALEDEDERFLNTLIDLYEQQPCAVALYWYQAVIDLLKPVAEELKATTLVETLKALIAIYEARETRPGEQR